MEAILWVAEAASEAGRALNWAAGRLSVDLNQAMLVLPAETWAEVECGDRQPVQYRIPTATASRPRDGHVKSRE